jgi:hypothetical protein
MTHSSDELHALDDAQMRDDMERARVTDDVYRFPRVHNGAEAARVEAFMWRQIENDNKP